MRYLWLVLLLGLSSCTPVLPPQQLATACRGDFTQAQLQLRHWLQGEEIWRLRQGALLEIGLKEIPLEGFLRLDLNQRTARLVALNEIGLVLFDLQVGPEGHQLLRAIPQLEQRRGFADGIAQSLRRMFLQPQLNSASEVTTVGNLQVITLKEDEQPTRFSFDCAGDLRELKGSTQQGSWVVRYNDYRDFSGRKLPEETIYYNRSHAVKLTLWLREARQEP